MASGDKRGQIDPDRLEYIWRQVADDIKADIADGALRPGSRLPTEVDLAENYGVARNTIRRAIKELADEKIIVVMHGRGTFIADPPPSER